MPNTSIERTPNVAAHVERSASFGAREEKINITQSISEDMIVEMMSLEYIQNGRLVKKSVLQYCCPHTSLIRNALLDFPSDYNNKGHKRLT